MPATCTADHGLRTIVAHVVRRTFPNTMRAHEDVARIEGANNFGDAVAIAHDERLRIGQYAVIDSVYACGCRGRG